MQPLNYFLPVYAFGSQPERFGDQQWGWSTFFLISTIILQLFRTDSTLLWEMCTVVLLAMVQIFPRRLVYAPFKDHVKGGPCLIKDNLYVLYWSVLTVLFLKRLSAFIRKEYKRNNIMWNSPLWSQAIEFLRYSRQRTLKMPPTSPEMMLLVPAQVLSSGYTRTNWVGFIPPYISYKPPRTGWLLKHCVSNKQTERSWFEHEIAFRMLFA